MVKDRMDLVFQYIFVYGSHKSDQGDNLSLEDIQAHSLLLSQALGEGLAYNYFDKEVVYNLERTDSLLCVYVLNYNYRQNFINT